MERRTYKQLQKAGRGNSPLGISPTGSSAFQTLPAFIFMRIVMKSDKKRIMPPETSNVYTLVKAAIKDGTLKPHRCWCGSRKQTYAHHRFYDEPLNVIWLCPDCHSKIHDRDVLLTPDVFETDKEIRRSTETAWAQSIHIIKNERYIKGRLHTAIC